MSGRGLPNSQPWCQNPDNGLVEVPPTDRELEAARLEHERDQAREAVAARALTYGAVLVHVPMPGQDGAGVTTVLPVWPAAMPDKAGWLPAWHIGSLAGKTFAPTIREAVEAWGREPGAPTVLEVHVFGEG